MRGAPPLTASAPSPSTTPSRPLLPSSSPACAISTIQPSSCPLFIFLNASISAPPARSSLCIFTLLPSWHAPWIPGWELVRALSNALHLHIPSACHPVLVFQLAASRRDSLTLALTKLDATECASLPLAHLDSRVTPFFWSVLTDPNHFCRSLPLLDVHIHRSKHPQWQYHPRSFPFPIQQVLFLSFFFLFLPIPASDHSWKPGIPSLPCFSIPKLRSFSSIRALYSTPTPISLFADEFITKPFCRSSSSPVKSVSS
ncbi:hypothetical protein QCA50_000318 [Cerrena zonata]|uniref:Uncharacterized protein n=1 Tax=Cerrena zonata TaxID=2478898 RepID=A0AAW0GYU6_9APHY